MCDWGNVGGLYLRYFVEPHNRNSRASVGMKEMHLDTDLTCRFLGSITEIQFNMAGGTKESAI